MIPQKQSGLPYQDPLGFDGWITSVVGKSEDTHVVLMGLTLDCCVLCAAQEFSFRGYKVSILKEATDTYSGEQKDKELICGKPIDNWANVINWSEFLELSDLRQGRG